MKLTTMDDNAFNCDANEVSSYQPELEGCIVRFKSGKSIYVKNRFAQSIKNIYSIQKLTGFDYKVGCKKGTFSVKHVRSRKLNND